MTWNYNLDEAPRDGRPVLVKLAEPITHWESCLLCEPVELTVTLARRWPHRIAATLEQRWVSIAPEPPEGSPPDSILRYREVKPVAWRDI